MQRLPKVEFQVTISSQSLQGHLKIVELLLSLGAEIEGKDSDNYRPLYAGQ
jgi:hypothetical protein